MREPFPVETVRPAFLSRTFKAFAYRDFRLMWLGALTSTTGTWMQTVAQAWLVFNLTDSAFYLGLTSFVAEFPLVVFTLIGGAVADRWDRRHLLLASQYTQMATATVLAALIFTGKIAMWHILVGATINGIAHAFGGPAYMALLPGLVTRKDVPNAIALNSIQFNLARTIGPVLAGWLLITVGAAACFALNGVSFLAVIASLYAIRPAFAPEKRAPGMIRDINAGFAYVKERSSLWQLTLLGFASTFLAIPILTLLPVFARDIFERGPQGYSTLMAFSGAGAVMGGLGFAALGHLRSQGKSALGLQASFGAILVAFALSPNFWFSSVLLLIGGSLLVGLFASVTSLVQLQASEEIRGRVMSIFMLAFRGGMPLGNLLAGWSAQQTSPRFTLAVNGTLLASIAAGFWISRSRIKEL